MRRGMNRERIGAMQGRQANADTEGCYCRGHPIIHDNLQSCRILFMADPKLTHIDGQGRARMVDVGQKPVTARQAVAEGFVILQSATLRSIVEGKVPKGEVLGTAR